MTTTVNPYAYNITVREIDFDGDTRFEARVKELPDVRSAGHLTGKPMNWRSTPLRRPLPCSMKEAGPSLHRPFSKMTSVDG